MHFQLPLTSARDTDGSSVGAHSSFAIMPGLGVCECLSCVPANHNTSVSQTFWEVILPADYNAMVEITVAVNTYHSAGSPSFHTLGMNAYLVDEVTGHQSVDQVMTDDLSLPAVATDLIFTIAGSPFKPGSRFLLVATSTITDTAGQNVSAVINSVRLSHP